MLSGQCLSFQISGHHTQPSPADFGVIPDLGRRYNRDEHFLEVLSE